MTFRSPEALLAEVILVDDASTMEHLGKDLEDYMAQYPKAKIRSRHGTVPKGKDRHSSLSFHLHHHQHHDQVKIVRAKKREGLIRARLLGAAKVIIAMVIKMVMVMVVRCIIMGRTTAKTRH